MIIYNVLYTYYEIMSYIPYILRVYEIMSYIPYILRVYEIMSYIPYILRVYENMSYVHVHVTSLCSIIHRVRSHYEIMKS